MKAKLLLLLAVLVLVGAAISRYQPRPVPRTTKTQSEAQPEIQPTGREQDLRETTKKIEVLPTIREIPLTILSPKTGASVNLAKVTIRGKTAARAEVAANEAETVADVNGNFSVTVSLEEGENYILLVATDEWGNVAEQELVVNYDISL